MAHEEMTLLDYDRLPREFPARFLPGSFDAADWSQVEKTVADLRGRRFRSTAGLKTWLEDYSELFDALSEEEAVRYIRMTEKTDDKKHRQDYLSFLERIEPRAKMAMFELNRKYSKSEYRKRLPRTKYSLLNLRIETSLKIFRRANVELQKKDKALGQEYQAIIGAMSVEYGGRRRTLPEMQKFLEEPDRSVREETWTLTRGRYLQDRERIDKIYQRMIDLRVKVAENAGFKNYRDYAFVNRQRFDYGPEECFQFHDAVEQHVVPLLRKVYEGRREQLKLDVLRPWDIVADPEGRKPLRPFGSADELIQGCHNVFQKVDPVLRRNFDRMVALGLLDVESRPGKAPGGYSAELQRIRLPFIFANTVGRDDDLRVLLHESGHAFHVFEMRDKDLPFLYRGDGLPTEFAEVASMSMELMAGEHLEGVFYDKDAAARSKYDHFRMITWLLAWIATVDAFQHWVYTHADSSGDERDDAWVTIHRRFGPGDDWDGLEDARRSYWQRQLHLFELPFYYIEYGIAQLGALGLWVRYQEDPRGAVAAYRNALALGGSKPLPELFRAAGLPWGFGPEVVKGYARRLSAILL